ncbi:MAG: poly-gamma-glutamate synthase PgsB [Candidatus Marinimicrobia bacterium]|nr:poly-gamma-glutamate synthase PgsB [Candidatus Neomarinimicrobiota bacterium]|tara:strand:- start:74 stop:1234 length:1161 start_codon:yes stop_codon:yes gene_type:complete
MIIFALATLIFILIIIGILEYQIHQVVLSKLPNRVHVNGSRGKSSVVRLIAAGLRAGGFRTLAKVTGTSPRVIDLNGYDRIIHRLRSPSIGEQLRLLRNFSKQNPDYIVVECMAVMPEYQWVSEHKMLKSDIGVITNVRMDHVDEMGYTMEEITKSLSNTVPKNGKIITTKCPTSYLIQEKSNKSNSEYFEVSGDTVNQDMMKDFPYLEHNENISLALEVCKQAGVDKKIALEGMINATPDPGALQIMNIDGKDKKNHFINAFAANDPQSTFQIFKLLKNRTNQNHIAIFLNSRSDRRYRTTQMYELVLNKIKPHLFIVRGDDLPKLDKFEHTQNCEIIIYPESTTPEELINYLISLSGEYIMGIGNMVGWGEEFILKLKQAKIND